MRGAATARARTERGFSGKGKEEREGASGGEGTRAHREGKKEKNWKTCARREKHEKRRLRDIETAAICAHSQEKCEEREDK